MNDITWQLDDDSATALSNDALPVVPPDLDDWQQPHGLFISGYIPAEFVTDTFFLRSHVTSVSLVPEPSILTLLALAGLFLRRKSRK